MSHRASTWGITTALSALPVLLAFGMASCSEDVILSADGPRNMPVAVDPNGPHVKPEPPGHGPEPKPSDPCDKACVPGELCLEVPAESGGASGASEASQAPGAEPTDTEPAGAQPPETHACIPQHPTQCRPCVDDADCWDRRPGYAGRLHRCLDMGDGSGSFCVTICQRGATPQLSGRAGERRGRNAGAPPEAEGEDSASAPSGRNDQNDMAALAASYDDPNSNCPIATRCLTETEVALGGTLLGADSNSSSDADGGSGSDHRDDDSALPGGAAPVGDPQTYCMPMGGVCGCSPQAIADGASTACSVQNDFGRCLGVRVCSETGLSACDAPMPAADVCNGVDDDCDGLTDEDFPQLGEACDGPDADRCSDGVWVCADDGGVRCDDSAAAHSEVCNGRDDDCDGRTDESLRPPLADPQHGVCFGSLMICRGEDGWVPPDFSALPGYEQPERSCDGRDNDCDGQTDEASDLVPPDAREQQGVCLGTKQVCRGFRGWREPDYAATVANYENPEVTCDGLDNDCDGLTDEALAPPPARLQQGVCAGAVQVCRGAGGWVEPDYASSIPAYETAETTCDGLDNDCDGAVDEDLEPPLNGNQQGLCEGTVQRCAGGAGWQEDYSSVPGHGQSEDPDDAFDDENCDGIDGDIGNAVFVAAWGIDIGSCTMTSPCRTMGYGLQQAVTQRRYHVYVQAGIYVEPLTVPRPLDAPANTDPLPEPQLLRIYGGYDIAWRRAAHTLPGHGVWLYGSYQASENLFAAVTLRHGGAFLADLTIMGPDAYGTTASGHGHASYGIHAVNSTVRLQRVTLRQGRGGDGMGGSWGVDGASFAAPAGAPGGNGSRYNTFCDDSSRGHGGAGARNLLCDGGTASGGGGVGGTMDDDCGFWVDFDATNGHGGGPAASWVPGVFGGPGHGGGECGGGGWGGNGRVVNGGGGAGAGLGGQRLGWHWHGRDGGPGRLGLDGTGGGGGGGSGGCDSGTDAYGAGGGGGGAGGCRSPQAGGGGRGGGASIGVAALGGSVVARQVRFVRGTGGRGGSGGPGGRGQSGGAAGPGGHGTSSTPGGGWGGRGGHGGHSGGGGGGAGGDSVGMWTVGASQVTQFSNIYEGGGGGSGGAGGIAAPSAPPGERDGQPGHNGARGAVAMTRIR